MVSGSITSHLTQWLALMFVKRHSRAVEPTNDSGDAKITFSEASFSMYVPRYQVISAEWWGRLELNQPPSGYEPPALTDELRPQNLSVKDFVAPSEASYAKTRVTTAPATSINLPAMY